MEEDDEDDELEDEDDDEELPDDDDELEAVELEDALEPVEELDDDGVGPVGLSPVVQPVRTPTPARAKPPDSTRRKSRLSVRRRSTSASVRCALVFCIATGTS